MSEYWNGRWNKSIPASWTESGKLINEVVSHIIGDKKYNKVFDFGCGIGGSYDFIKGLAKEYVGYDFSIVAIDKFKQSNPTANVKPYIEDNGFDLIYCNNVLQHIMDDDEFIGTIHKLKALCVNGAEIIVIDNITDKDNLGYIAYRTDSKHKSIFNICGLMIIDEKEIKIENETTKIWRLKW